ncbi:hypothetical protein G9444_4010 [Rhodococcus erythropolis]|uniref:Uncharacterized protein n=1 Tax=Rhodococcus erythropolis TaxID=1833 RepID=A0A6G9CW27_RHOER|nr:hypothetical protein G9444_4010 [Rhodococcus erythropolis]
MRRTHPGLFEGIHDVGRRPRNDAQSLGKKPESNRLAHSGQYSQRSALRRRETEWFQRCHLTSADEPCHGHHDVGEFALSGMHGVSLALLVSAS